MQQSRIEIISEKKLVGKRLQMSFANNKTAELWRSFMPRRKEIENTVSPDLFSLQNYNQINPFLNFNPEEVFEKWAVIEVSSFENIPEDMEAFTLVEGKYAVFSHKGQSTDIFMYIFNTWLPQSNYQLDHRPHFEILGEKYKNNHPDSEEEIWIPIQ